MQDLNLIPVYETKSKKIKSKATKEDIKNVLVNALKSKSGVTMIPNEVMALIAKELGYSTITEITRGKEDKEKKLKWTTITHEIN